MQSAETLGPLEQKMEAYEFFHQIVEPNCENALRPPYHLRLAWNAIVSLNAVPEFIVLHRLGYETDVWPAPGSGDTELGVLMEPEVDHGETEVYPRVQA